MYCNKGLLKEKDPLLRVKIEYKAPLESNQEEYTYISKEAVYSNESKANDLLDEKLPSDILLGDIR
jgi:hypothetical protein